MTGDPWTSETPQAPKQVRVFGEREFLTMSVSVRPPFKGFLEGPEYRAVLNGIAKGCVDVALYDPDAEHFLIGTRQKEPHIGDWLIGGHMIAGETTEEATASVINYKLGVDIDPARLKQIDGAYHFVWDTRNEQPTPLGDGTGRRITGTHNVVNLSLYFTDADERRAIESNEDYYSQLQWLSADDILEAPTGTYHPGLVKMITDSLEVLTRPEPPRTADEHRLRLAGQIATAKATLARLELLQRLGNGLAELDRKNQPPPQ